MKAAFFRKGASLNETNPGKVKIKKGAGKLTLLKINPVFSCNVSDVNSSVFPGGFGLCGMFRIRGVVTDLAQWAVLPVSVFLQCTEISIQFGKFV